MESKSVQRRLNVQAKPTYLKKRWKETLERIKKYHGLNNTELVKILKIMSNPGDEPVGQLFGYTDSNEFIREFIEGVEKKQKQRKDARARRNP